jgi:hypothetical protein
MRAPDSRARIVRPRLDCHCSRYRSLWRPSRWLFICAPCRRQPQPAQPIPAPSRPPAASMRYPAERRAQRTVRKTHRTIANLASERIHHPRAAKRPYTVSRGRREPLRRISRPQAGVVSAKFASVASFGLRASLRSFLWRRDINYLPMWGPSVELWAPR